jgi:hypothetical protein
MRMRRFSKNSRDDAYPLIRLREGSLAARQSVRLRPSPPSTTRDTDSLLRRHTPPSHWGQARRCPSPRRPSPPPSGPHRAFPDPPSGPHRAFPDPPSGPHRAFPDPPSQTISTFVFPNSLAVNPTFEVRGPNRAAALQPGQPLPPRPTSCACCYTSCACCSCACCSCACCSCACCYNKCACCYTSCSCCSCSCCSCACCSCACCSCACCYTSCACCSCACCS